MQSGVCSDSYKDLDCEELLDLFLSADVHLNKRICLGHAGVQESATGEKTRL